MENSKKTSGLKTFVNPRFRAIFCTVVLLSLGVLGCVWSQSLSDPELKDHWDISWSQDGNRLAVAGDLGIFIFNEEFEEIAHSDTTANSIVWGPNDEMLVTGSGETISFWDSENLASKVTFDVGPIFALDWHLDRNLLAGKVNSRTAQGWTFLVKTWAVRQDESGNIVDFPEQQSVSIGDFTWFVWSPDGAQIATSDIDGMIQIWDVENGELRTSIQYPGNTSLTIAPSIAWNQRGKLVGVRGENAIYLWDTQTGQLVNSFNGYVWNAQYIAWSPDGNRFAISARNYVYIVDSNTGSVLNEIESNPDNYITHIVWGPNNFLIAGIGAIGTKPTTWVWNSETGEEIAYIPTE